MRRDRRCDDGAGNLVQPLVDHAKRVAAAVVLLAGEVIDGAGKRAHLFLERAQGQRFRQVVDGIADLLQPVGQNRQARVVRALALIGVDTVLESRPAAIEIVPAAVDLLHALFARQRVERGFDLFELEPQHVDASVVALLGQRLDGAGKPFEFKTEFGAALGRSAGPGARLESPLDLLAQCFEFALQP